MTEQNNYELNPQVHGLFGEHVNVRLDEVTVERPDGSDPVVMPVLVLEVEDVDATEIKVLLDEGSAATLIGALTAHLGLLRYPDVIEKIKQTHAGTAETVDVVRGMLAREAVASTRMDRGETIAIGTPQTNYAVAPGEWLQEWLEDRTMSWDQAASLLGRSRKEIDDIVSGKTPITSELAEELANLTNMPAKSWLRIEEMYRSDVERLAQKDKEG